MADAPTNLQKLSPSRRRPRAGDVFAMRPPDDEFLFGRVIRTDALPPMDAVLIYVYAARSASSEPPDNLTPRSLLIPPALTNELGWFHGRFATVGHVPLAADDVLPQHCFHAAGRYYDADGNTLDRPTEPCGLGGVISYRMLDDLISDALRIPRMRA